jgi:hypothetical protein
MVADTPLRAGSSSAVAPLALVLLAALAAGACRADLPDVPVRTTTESGSWTAPSAAGAAGRDRALVRIVSAIPGESRLDLFVDGGKLADAVVYKSITPYLEVPAGRHALRLRPAGMDTADPLADENQNLRAGRHYTVVLVPGEEGRAAAGIRIFDDALEAPEAQRATLRIIHAGADAGSVDVYVEGRQDPIARGLDVHSASDVTTVDPPALIELRPAGRTEAMLRLPDLRLTAGGMYTVVVIGRTRIDPPLETLVLEDRIARQ